MISDNNNNHGFKYVRERKTQNEGILAKVTFL